MKSWPMTFLYFAYGSNMLPARLLGRCPSAKAVGLGVARAWSLEFSKASKDGSGKATLVAAPNSAIPGVIFEIDLAEREHLTSTRGWVLATGAPMLSPSKEPPFRPAPISAPRWTQRYSLSIGTSRLSLLAPNITGWMQPISPR